MREKIDWKFEKKFLREGSQTKNENYMILARFSYVAWLKLKELDIVQVWTKKNPDPIASSNHSYLKKQFYKELKRKKGLYVQCTQI